ncbi:uncharacterized protein PGTG_12324 [Puccinia graminis f. sp. tritici CRL 75-36-700-3]|uniref:DUF125-domain-containing protein n=1 Tax=Puccinia graminis f. sp. tritici (strain CRL 75-36-700-3 / race SCCL) TaxID=418459 RepID=E3KPY3_PUCGT|nr:uncharacterized protein PGTG_12324 [Puccinia graminis f. sp. tritici CRL 75-36-700-3]EFP86368.1 hypothetical protein PGTG_12324 [Puccinia graminis f. sp. tritici CRL 75-36-700-3]
MVETGKPVIQESSSTTSAPSTSVPLPKNSSLRPSASSSDNTENPNQKQKKVWDYYSDEAPSRPSEQSEADNALKPSSSIGSLSSSSNTHTKNNITPHLNKCDKKSRPEDIQVCCRELRGDDERHLINPDIVRDVIIGLSDGLTVPFGLTAGLSSLGSSRLVVVGGIAELISGAISMGVGGYLASEAERDHFKYLQKTTKERVARSCSGEMEREVHEVLGPMGLDESISRTVAAALLRAESEADECIDRTAEPAEESTARWLLRCLGRQPKFFKQIDGGNHQLRWAKDIGITPFLLKFGEGLEEVPESRLYISALTIGLSYFIGGLVPMGPYFFIESAQIALYWSIAIMFITLLIFGVFKAYFTGAKIGFVGYLKASSATIVVGGAAAAASWLIVKVLEKP